MPGHTRFFLSIFFLQPGLVAASSQPSSESTRRAGFQNYDWNNLLRAILKKDENLINSSLETRTNMQM